MYLSIVPVYLVCITVGVSCLTKMEGFPFQEDPRSRLLDLKNGGSALREGSGGG